MPQGGFHHGCSHAGVRGNLGTATMVGEFFTAGFGVDCEALRLAPFSLIAIDKTLFAHFPAGRYDHASL